ncbi:MAG TPA: MBL fold metallo-hydrolase [Vicinamibacterales bacterium]|nr:MBL fold metallo-hydrolase [Vicinamibacterales bacterium]
MNRIVSAVVVAAVMAAGGALRAQRGPLPAPMIKEGVTQKIAEHVYVIPDFDMVLVPNVTIVVGSRGALVVDTGMGARNGQAIMREVEKVSKGQELYLVATHIHPEHDLGAGGFPARTKMVRSKEQEADIQETGLSTARIFANFSPVIGELLQGAEFRKADISFEREHVVDLGGVRARVMAMGANHTRSDIAVAIEPDRVLVAGDLVMMGLPQFTAPTARFATWLSSLDRFDALKPVRIVPSHGAMGDASMIATYRAFLTTVRDRAATLKKDGRTSDETVRTLQDELQGRYNRNQMASAVRAAYNEAQ